MREEQKYGKKELVHNKRSHSFLTRVDSLSERITAVRAPSIESNQIITNILLPVYIGITASDTYTLFKVEQCLSSVLFFLLHYFYHTHTHTKYS